MGVGSGSPVLGPVSPTRQVCLLHTSWRMWWVRAAAAGHCPQEEEGPHVTVYGLVWSVMSSPSLNGCVCSRERVSGPCLPSLHSLSLPVSL